MDKTDIVGSDVVDERVRTADVLLLVGASMLLLAVGVYEGYSAWARKHDAQQFDPAAVQSAAAQAETAAAAVPRDPRFTLEVRRVGVTVDRFRQRALLMRLEEAGPNRHATAAGSKGLSVVFRRAR